MGYKKLAKRKRKTKPKSIKKDKVKNVKPEPEEFSDEEVEEFLKKKCIYSHNPEPEDIRNIQVGKDGKYDLEEMFG